MFDWDEVPEQLGGPNKAALQVEAEAEAELRTREVKSETPAERAERRRLERAHASGNSTGSATGQSREPKRVAAKKTQAADTPTERLVKAARSGSLIAVMRTLQTGVDPNAESERGTFAIQEAAAANSLDACAALLLHGAEARTFARSAMPGSPVQQLLELFAGRAPGPGELPKLVNSVDPLLRPQVAQSLMSLAQSAAVAGAPAPAAAPGAAPAAAPRSAPSAPSAPPTRASADPGRQSGAPKAQAGYSGVPPTTATRNGRDLQMNGHMAQKASAPAQGRRTAEVRKEGQAPNGKPPRATGGSHVPHASFLGRAAAADDLVEVTNLLKARAEPNEYDKKGETPLFTAVSDASPDVVAMLLLCNAEPLTKSIHGTTPWEVAACRQTRSLLSFFAGQELEETEKTQLLDSLSQGMQEAIGHAISERAANRRGLRPAEEVPNEDGAPIRQRPLPPLPPEVKKARDAMAAKDLNQDPLACAARTGDVEEVLRLLDGGHDPNIGDELGETPLFEAASAGSVDVVAALLVKRADPGKRSLSGGIAADLAADSVTRSLLSTYAGIKISDEEKAAACGAIKDDELRESVANKFRAEHFRGSVLPRYMQLLRA